MDSIESLKVSGLKPRLHPNGFITVDLDTKRKLHVWPEVPIRRRSEDGMVHDHVFGFRSKVHVGQVRDKRFAVEPDPNGTHEMYVVDCVGGRTHTESRPSSGLVRKDNQLYKLVPTQKRIIRPGQQYDFPVETFHQSVPNGFTATVMEITDFGKAPSARIMYPKGVQPQPFTREPRNADEERRMWEAVAQGIRYTKAI